MKNKTFENIKEYSCAGLTIASILMGVFSFLIYYCYGNWIYAYYCLWVAVMVILALLYRSIRKKYENEDWSNVVVVTSIIIPLFIGGFVSVVLSGNI